MVRLWNVAATLGALVAPVLSCGEDDSCYGPQTHVMTRHVRRMQPESLSALSGPRGPLAWGEINFLHTTDTHGWLEGHLKEHNYGADWGDYRSFVRDMRLKAARWGVDLLVVDTGDLHDGNGLSDATSPNGKVSNSIFQTVPMDLLTIGNHELYLTDVAQLQAGQFAKSYGDKYLTSNVKIYNPTTQAYDFIGAPYRYFTTDHGIRIMAFGVLFNFRGNSNISQITPAATLVNQTWFINAVNYNQPIDLFVVIGHNPVRPTVSSSTLSIVQSAIRKMRPNIPIQIFGGHQHVRDFSVYDSMSTGLGSGRYCETLGWLSMTGIRGSNYTSKARKSIPGYVPMPSMPAVAVVVNGTTTSTVSSPTATASSNLRYFRRYLDWNRATFEYHANGSQTQQITAPNGTKISSTWDTASGLSISQRIYNARQKLNTTFVYGCAPQSWTINASPFGSNTSVFTVLGDAYAMVVVNESRADLPRIIVDNTGNVRFDLVQGPFTVDDGFIVSPFYNTIVYVPQVPYSIAKTIVPTLNAGPYIKRRTTDLTPRDFGFTTLPLLEADPCELASHSSSPLHTRSTHSGLLKRQEIVTAGYTTTDDFGTDGDDTIHNPITRYPVPNVFQSTAAFPADGSDPDAVDVVLVDYIIPNVLSAMNANGGNYTTASFQTYVAGLISNEVLPIYASVAPSWHPEGGVCVSGTGVQ